MRVSPGRSVQRESQLGIDPLCGLASSHVCHLMPTMLYVSWIFKVIALIITLLGLVSVADVAKTTYLCDEAADVYVVRDNEPINRVLVHENGALSVTELGNTRWIPGLPASGRGKSHAGEHGIVINHNGLRALVIPAGKEGLNNSLYMFDIDTEELTNIGVYCKPVGVAYSDQYGEIVGFCAVNYTISRTHCVPYFKVRKSQGRWTDVSEQSSCSYGLSTTDLTNPVILKYSTPHDHTVVKLYFAEMRTNKLHEIDLEQQTSQYYHVPLSYGDGVLTIDPAVSNDFIGIRIESSGDNFHDVDHTLFSSTTQRFTHNFPQTVTTAFASYNLDYLVSFDADHRELIISKDDWTRKSITLSSTLDDPIDCQNMARPSYHYLICLARHGHAVHLINITQNAWLTDETVHAGSVSIVHIGIVGNTFYLINQQKKMIFYSIVGSTVTQIGMLSNHTTGTRIVNSASNISCKSVHLNHDQISELDVIPKLREVVVINSNTQPNSNNIEISNSRHAHDPLETETAIIVFSIVVGLGIFGIVTIVIATFIFIRVHCWRKSTTKSLSVSTVSSIQQATATEPKQAHGTVDLYPRNAPIPIVANLGEPAPIPPEESPVYTVTLKPSTSDSHVTRQSNDAVKKVEDFQVCGPVQCSRSLSSIANTSPNETDSYNE